MACKLDSLTIKGILVLFLASYNSHISSCDSFHVTTITQYKYISHLEMSKFINEALPTTLLKQLSYTKPCGYLPKQRKNCPTKLSNNELTLPQAKMRPIPSSADHKLFTYYWNNQVLKCN